MTLSPEYLTAKAKLESFCAYQERCTYEVNEKLKAFDLNDAEKKSLLDFLRSNKYLDDERFAQSYASGKFVIKGWGKNKIRSHMKAKFVAAELIELGLSEIEEEPYLERMKHLAKRKWDDLSKEKNEWVRKQKVFRFLAGKGYEPFLFDQLDF